MKFDTIEGYFLRYVALPTHQELASYFYNCFFDFARCRFLLELLQFDLQRGIQLPVESANEKPCKRINQTSRFKTQSICQQNLLIYIYLYMYI